MNNGELNLSYFINTRTLPPKKHGTKLRHHANGSELVNNLELAERSKLGMLRLTTLDYPKGRSFIMENFPLGNVFSFRIRPVLLCDIVVVKLRHTEVTIFTFT